MLMRSFAVRSSLQGLASSPPPGGPALASSPQPGDGSALQQQAMASADGHRRLRELQRIEAALKRLDEGEYGDCLSCGEEIAEKRLRLDPAATQCVDCAR